MRRYGCHHHRSNLDRAPSHGQPLRAANVGVWVYISLGFLSFWLCQSQQSSTVLSFFLLPNSIALRSYTGIVTIVEVESLTNTTLPQTTFDTSPTCVTPPSPSLPLRRHQLQPSPYGLAKALAVLPSGLPSPPSFKPTFLAVVRMLTKPSVLPSTTASTMAVTVVSFLQTSVEDQRTPVSPQSARSSRAGVTSTKSAPQT